jgi:hypothetical protein
MVRNTNLIKRGLGRISLALAYEKQHGKHLSNPRTSSPNKWSSWGTYTPHKENQLLENWSGEDRSIRGPVDGRSLV